MKRNKTQTEKTSESCRCVLCIAVIAVFAMFAACQRPEPEPEPPTPPVVDTDTLPANKFVGTWVLCGVSSSDGELLCSNSDSFSSIDTLVFTADNALTIRHGSESVSFFYDFTSSFLLYYNQSQQLTPYRVVYSFCNEGAELKITGYLYNIQGGSQTTSCFVKIDTTTENFPDAPTVPTNNRYLGTWVSCCWTSNLNEDPDYNCIDSWSGDTLVFTENTMLQKTTWCGVVENEYEYTNTHSYLVYFRENLGFHQPNFINRTKFINDTFLIIYAWEYPAYDPCEGQQYNVSFKKMK